MEAGWLPPSNLNVSLAERRGATWVHIGVLILALLTSWAAGLAGAIGAAAIVLIRPMGSDFIAGHAKEAFNFNLSMFFYVVAGIMVIVLTLGLGLIIVLPIFLVLAIAWLACSITAAMKASNGEIYLYPFTLRLWK